MVPPIQSVAAPVKAISVTASASVEEPVTPVEPSVEVTLPITQSFVTPLADIGPVKAISVEVPVSNPESPSLHPFLLEGNQGDGLSSSLVLYSGKGKEAYAAPVIEEPDLSLSEKEGIDTFDMIASKLTSLNSSIHGFKTSQKLDSEFVHFQRSHSV